MPIYDARLNFHGPNPGPSWEPLPPGEPFPARHCKVFDATGAEIPCVRRCNTETGHIERFRLKPGTRVFEIDPTSHRAIVDLDERPAPLRVEVVRETPEEVADGIIDCYEVTTMGGFDRYTDQNHVRGVTVGRLRQQIEDAIRDAVAADRWERMGAIDFNPQGAPDLKELAAAIKEHYTTGKVVTMPDGYTVNLHSGTVTVPGESSAGMVVAGLSKQMEEAVGLPVAGVIDANGYRPVADTPVEVPTRG